jgi:hypothetical protein
MKKLIIVSLIVMVAGSICFASPLAKAKRQVIADNPNEVATSSALTPSTKISVGSTPKAAGVFIDSSRNAFGVYTSETEPIVVYNDSIAFVYRQYPTSSGRLACAASGDFGASWTIDYDLNAPLTTSRYPSAIGGVAPYGTAVCLEGGTWGSGIAAYNVGGWLSTLWDSYVQVMGNLGLVRIYGRYLNDGTVMFIGNSVNGLVYKAQYSGDLTSELMAASPIWDPALGDSASSVGIDYHYGRLVEMASTWGNTSSAYQYVQSDDNGVTGWTGADTISFNLTGLNDSILVDSRFVINNDTMPVMILAVAANEDTIDINWTGIYLYSSIICALPNGEHYTIYDPAGSNETGEGCGCVVGLARGQGDTLVAAWMRCADVTNYTGGTLDWDILLSMSADGGHTWSANPTVVGNVGMAECFPHLALDVTSNGNIHMIYAANDSLDLYYDAYIGAGNAYACDNYWFTMPTYTVGMEGEASVTTPRSKLALNQSVPNPARGTARISFTLPKAGDYSLRVFNIAGQLIRTLDSKGVAGMNTVNWNGCDNNGQTVANGVYLYSLKAEGKSITKKMTIVR